MDRLEELYTKMVDEAPRFFPESNKPYILELAQQYATEVARHNLERAANKTHKVDGYSTIVTFTGLEQKAITSLEIELI